MERLTAIPAADAEGVELLEQTPEYLTVYDLTDGRELRYRTGPIDEAWLENSLRFSPDIGQPEKDRIHDALMWVLCRIDPNMLVLLKAVYIVVGENDEAYVAEQSGCEAEELPFDALTGECIGLMWWAECSVFIHYGAIKNIVETECDQYGEWWRYDKTMYEALTSTMAHELRHLGLSNPFLDEIEYPVSEEAEEAVEQWALAFCGLN